MTLSGITPSGRQERARCFRAPIRTDIKAWGGFTLIEVLIALVVMMVGMLGVSFLCIEGLRLNRSAIYRATAQNLAADIVERIRAGLAEDDAVRWQQDMKERLPRGATATVNVTPAMNPGPSITRYNISLQWPEPGRAEPAAYTLVAHVQIN